MLRAGGKFAWAISKTSAFTEELVSEIGSDATISKSVTALTAKVNSKLAMKTSLTIKNNSKAPENTKATDSEVAMTLVFSY